MRRKDEQVHRAVQDIHIVAHTQEDDPAVAGRRHRFWVERVRLIGLVGADNDQREAIV